jgi:hypothetical protein
MTRLLVILGLLLVIAGGGLTALSDSGDAGSTVSEATDDGSQTPAQPPDAAPTPAPAENRQDCNAIRGTDYLSPEERDWFLANCVPR